MRYAIIRNRIIISVYELTPEGAAENPDSVPIGDVPAGVGDTYADGVFSRDGQPLLTPIQTAEATIAALDATVLELEMANAMITLGL